MAGYNDAIEMLGDQCADPIGAAYLRRRRHELERATRGADTGLMKVLQDERDKQASTCRKKHAELRAADRAAEKERLDQKKKADEKKLIEEEEKQKTTKNCMNWRVGQGLEGA